MPSLELYYKPGTFIYGVAMFHQLHCLVSFFYYQENYIDGHANELVQDVLRRSYYPYVTTCDPGPSEDTSMQS